MSPEKIPSILVKLWENSKDCMSCVPLLAMNTKRQVEEIGKLKWFVAQSMNAILIVVPLLLSMAYYGGKLVTTVEHISTSVVELRKDVNDNMQSITALDENIKSAANNMVKVEKRLGKLEAKK